MALQAARLIANCEALVYGAQSIRDPQLAVTADGRQRDMSRPIAILEAEVGRCQSLDADISKLKLELLARALEGGVKGAAAEYLRSQAALPGRPAPKVSEWRDGDINQLLVRDALDCDRRSLRTAYLRSLGSASPLTPIQRLAMKQTMDRLGDKLPDRGMPSDVLSLVPTPDPTKFSADDRQVADQMTTAILSHCER